jgi:hypothetical protein
LANNERGLSRVENLLTPEPLTLVDFHSRLEHPSSDGAEYFVTWRLEGSLPVARVAEFWTSDGPKFVEFDRLLDAVSTGPRWLERPDIASIVMNVILSGERESRYELGAWVVMPNHVHTAFRPLGGNGLGSTINSIKGRSAREANLLLSRSGAKFWAKDYFDRRNSRPGPRGEGYPVD